MTGIGTGLDSPSPSRPPTPPEVLIVEDDSSLRRVLDVSMRTRGYATRLAATGGDALAACADRVPDVVLLDLSLPDMDGMDVCRELRRTARTPIIVITADGADERKIDLLDEGADDYVTKPFSLPELHARIRVARRVASGYQAVIAEERLTLGDLVIDVASRRVGLAGRDLTLTRREYGVLLVLARSAGELLTTDALLNEAWGPEWIGNVATLRKHLSVLRSKLGNGPGSPSIVAGPGGGYRMIAPSADAAGAGDNVSPTPAPLRRTR